MSLLAASVEQAARRVVASTPLQDWNPVYRALAPDPAHLGAGVDEIDADPGSEEILRHQFSARALLVAAVSEKSSTGRLRLGLHPAGTTVEFSRDDAPSTWSAVSAERVPTLVEELLAPAGYTSAPPRLSVRQDDDGLRLTPAQIEQVRQELARGTASADAFAVADDLDPRLLEAFTTQGPRAAVSLTLHDPSGEVAEDPETWSRLWVRGGRGLYRMDGTEAVLGAVHPVEEGDVLGTVLPILEEGLRFAAACSTRDGSP